MTSRQPDFFGVPLPTMRGPAFHVCRFPVTARRPPDELAIVPHPERDAWLPGALAIAGLMLPEGYAGRRYALVPASMDVAAPLWDEDPDLPLLLPLPVVHERRVSREWQVELLVTPGSLGVASPPSALAQVAWGVLSRLESHEAIRLHGQLALLADQARIDPATAVRLIGEMKPPMAVNGGLLAAARNGEPVLHPRGVLWVLRELLAASHDERAEAAIQAQRGEALLLGRAWFRCLRGGRRPGPDEVLLATWMLHECFHGGDRHDDAGPDGLASLTTTLGYRFNVPGRWLRELNRWAHIWSVANEHPAVADAPIDTDSLRATFSEALGCTVEEWFAGTWLICIRWWMGVQGTQPFPMDPTEVTSLPVENKVVEASRRYQGAVRRHAVSGVDAFVEAVRTEKPPGRSGYGHLPQSDSLACRNSPIIELPNGEWLPLGIELVADRATSIHRLLLGARGQAATTIGRMFESYVADLMADAGRRHVVVTEEALASVVGAGSRCDGLILHGADYLAVETSIQTLSRAVANGQIRAIYAMAERYQHEAEQALATIRDLPRVAAALRLPQPTSAVHLVVTDAPVPQSPAFRRVLRRLSPSMSDRFVCGITEFENLLALGNAGWSIPAAVASWQARPDDVALDVHLARLADTHRPPEREGNDVETWLDRLDPEWRAA